VASNGLRPVDIFAGPTSGGPLLSAEPLPTPARVEISVWGWVDRSGSWAEAGEGHGKSTHKDEAARPAVDGTPDQQHRDNGWPH